MSVPSTEAQVLASARSAVARLIDQLSSDHQAVIVRSDRARWTAGEERLAAAKASAERLAAVLKSSSGVNPS